MFESMGAVLAAELAAADPPGLEDEALVDAICGWERLASWVAAGQSAAIAELARRRRPLDRDGADRAGGDSGHPGLPAVSEFAVDEVAAALRLSRCAAGNRLLVAVELAERLPATAAALRAGELDALKVRRIVEATTVLSDEAAAAVERRVLPRASEQTVSQLRVSLSRAVLAVDPADAETRHRRAVADRRMCLTPLEDGMAELWALLPADGAAAIRCAVDVLARRGPSSNGRGMDGRTMDNRRADALVELAVDALDRARRRIPASGAASAIPSPRTAARAGETTPADERADEPTAVGGRQRSGNRLTRGRDAAGHPGCGRRCMSPCRSALCSGWAVSRVSWPGTVRSRLRWRAGSPSTAPGGGSSPTLPAALSSTSAGAPTYLRRRSRSM